MTLYDTFIFHNEFTLLELRLQLLGPHVDYFVIAEADKTFQGNAREYQVEDFLLQLPDYIGAKTRVIKVNQLENGTGDGAAWQREYHQRNEIMRGLYDAQPNDVIMLSDCDEIPNPDVLDQVRNTNTLVTLEQYLSYYYINMRVQGEYWNGTKIIPRRMISTMQQLRNTGTPNIIPNGGWHVSYAGGMQTMQEKLRSFSHAVGLQKYNEANYLWERINEGEDIFARHYKYVTVPIDNTFPFNIYDYPQLIRSTE